MNKFLTLCLGLALTVAGTQDAQALKVHTIGDSTMQTYDENSTNTRGWGQYLQQFFKGLTVNNRGKAGASSKSFYKESAYWQSVKKQMQPGDYVLIQFSHNDEKSNGMDGDELKAYYEKTGQTELAKQTDYRGTTPSGTYKDYLRKYVNETRAAGCTPILVAPICRMYFSGNTISRTGQHDLGDKFQKLTADGVLSNQKVPASDHSMDYVYQMKLVAEELNVPFIDMTTATKDLYLSYGDEKCHNILGDQKGSTHLATTGATLIARLCAQLLQKANILTDYIYLPSELTVSPEKADMGKAYKGQVLTKEFSLSGFSLSPADGAVTINADNGMMLSLDKQTWTSSVTANYTDGTLIQNFYLQFTLNQNGEQNGTVTVKQGDKTVSIPVTATAVSLEGGTEVTAYWRLESNNDCTLTGPATVVPQTFEGMYIQKYSAPNANTVWPDWTGYEPTRKTQRCLIEGDTWPKDEIDEVSTRYIQFGITAAQGTTLSIDNISMFVCGCGGNGMRCKVYYSTSPDFADPQNFFMPASMPANNMLEVYVKPVVSLSEGQSLLVRVYPWYNGTATGKTICLSDLTIHGMAMDATGIANAKADSRQKSTYYTLTGLPVSHPQSGIYIRDGKKVGVR